MATKRTPSATPATTTPATPATPATPKFRQIDSAQFLLHAKKMDAIHVSKSTPRKFQHFVNLNESEIAILLNDSGIENVNAFINIAVNAKSPDGVRAAIAAGTIATLTVRKK